MQENSVHWEKRRKEIEQERERKLEEWEKKKRFEKIAFLEKKWLDKKQGVENENEKIQNNMQPEEKKWTVWRENKGENIVTPSKPSPQEISFPRKSPPSEKQTPSDLTKSPLYSPSPSPKKVPPTPAGGKLKQEIKNIEKENLHKPSTTQNTIESFIAKQTDRQSNNKPDKKLTTKQNNKNITTKYQQKREKNLIQEKENEKMKGFMKRFIQNNERENSLEASPKNGEQKQATQLLSWDSTDPKNVPGKSSSLSSHNPDGENKTNMEHSRGKSVILGTAHNKRLKSVIIPRSDEISEIKDMDIIL